MNIFAKAALAGAAAFAVFACGRDEIDVVNVEPSSVRTVRFTASVVDTKAQFGEEENGSWPTLWSVNDSQLKLSLNYGTALTSGITPTQDFKSASFSATIDFSGIDGPYTYYAVSPASAAQALSPSREAWKVSIPCEQTPSAASPDEDGIILASTSAHYSTVDEAEKIDLFFNHLTAYGRISLANLALASGETVQAVELTATTPFVGDWYWNTSGSSITDYGASSTLTLNTSATSGIWFACAPVSVGDEILTVNVFTNLGVFKKMTLFPEGCKFESGQAAIFTVDMDGADYTAAGSSSIITPVTVSMNTFTALSGYVNGDENVSYEATQGTAQNAPVVNSDEIRIYQNGGLLTVSANNGKTITSVTIGSSMATTVQVSIDGGDYGSNNSISANGTYSTGTISASSVRFKCTGTSKTARLYLNSLSVTYAGSGSGQVSADDPLLQESEYGCYLGTGLTWAINAGSEQVSRSYDSDGVQTYTLIDPAEVEEIEIIGYKKSYLKGDSFSVSVCWRKGVNVIHNEYYDVTLIKEAGPKVWLSAGNGNGFIIKK